MTSRTTAHPRHAERAQITCTTATGEILGHFTYSPPANGRVDDGRGPICCRNWMSRLRADTNSAESEQLQRELDAACPCFQPTSLSKTRLHDLLTASDSPEGMWMNNR